MSDRVYKQYQEEKLYELRFAQEILAAGKPDYLKSYLGMALEKAKCGMTADEIDAVEARVKKAASEAR